MIEIAIQSIQFILEEPTVGAYATLMAIAVIVYLNR